VASITPQQERTRERFESLIRFAAPALDAVLALGDRVSRRFVPASTGPEGFPIRALERAPQAPPGDEPGESPGSE
jgi:hypothetical protein